MASLIPAFVTAMQDRSIRGNARDVYIWFHEHLDVVEYRPVKHSVIEVEIGMSDSSVADSITRLLERGYLARGVRYGQLWTYRLIYSCPEIRRSA